MNNSQFNFQFQHSENENSLSKNSPGFQMLQLIILNNGATKYECLTQALGKVGSKQMLRKKYALFFNAWLNTNVCTYNHRTHKYRCTSHGAELFVKASEKYKHQDI